MSEFVGVDPQAVPFVADEAAGDLEVWRGEVLIGSHPWHCHAHVDGGHLYIFDGFHGLRVHDYPPGTWTKVKNRNA